MAERVWNFCAGPAALPQPVLQQAAEELSNWRGSGMSVMEMSHRSSEVQELFAQTEADLRSLLGIGEDYSVLFIQGGASQQFAQVPMNLAGADAPVDYLCTGTWSARAIEEAHKVCPGRVNVVASNAEGEPKYTTVPLRDSWSLSPDAAYFHYTPNETIVGVEMSDIPQVDAPIVADLSSTILSRPLDVSRFGLIYAGAQKNMGPSGMAVVIVRKDLIRADLPLPSALSYHAFAKAASMPNTPPVFSVYIASLVYRWLLQRGGLQAMQRENQTKSQLLYDYLDSTDFYSNPVDKAYRSWMNIPFILADSALDKEFLQQAEQAGLHNLKGHRSVGGMRASLYNATPVQAVEDLVDFMHRFAQKNG